MLPRGAHVRLCWHGACNGGTGHRRPRVSPMTDALAMTTPISALPLIDIGGLGAAKPLVRRGVVEAIRDACLSKGFFYISNHGIAPSLIDAALRESRNFFALPLTERLRVRRECSICNRGYEPMGGQDL